MVIQVSDAQKLRTISSITAIITLATQLEYAVMNGEEEEIVQLYHDLKLQPYVIRAYLRGLSQNLNDKIKPGMGR